MPFNGSATALFVGIGLSNAHCTATLHGYNGPACNCLLSLNWLKTGTNFSAGFDVAQVVIQAAATNVTVNFNGTTPNGASSTPFTVPDGTVVPYDINFTFSVSATVFLGQLSDVTLSLSGTITNV